MTDTLAADLVDWTVGPFHEALPGPMRLNLVLDGEVITSCSVETGFSHKGLEKTLELRRWTSILPCVDHLDPEAAIFGEVVLCRAVEEICEIEVPKRAQAIRSMLGEMVRITSHLGFLARMARSVGSEMMVHHVLQDRERFLDLFELLTGARFSFNFLRFGGVAFDITEGFVERLLDVGDVVRSRLKEYNDLFSFNHSFLQRSVDIAPMTLEQVTRLGVTGPSARASGFDFDIRKSRPYDLYGELDFKVPLGEGIYGVRGDVHDRYLVRLREISESLDIIRQIANLLPNGDHLNPSLSGDLIVPAGEAYVAVESPRGLLGCHLVSDERTGPCRVQFRTPSLFQLNAIPELLSGCRIEDFRVVLASLDISMAEVDR